MRYLRGALVVVAMLLAVAMSAFAGGAPTVTLKFVGTGGNNGGGEYTYPYYFNVGTSTTATPLICDDFDNNITSGQSWTAYVTPLLSFSGWFADPTHLPNYVQDYEAAGLIFEAITKGTIDATLGNWAIWGLFSSTAFNNSFYQNNITAINAFLSPIWAEVNSSNFSSTSDYASLANLVVYTPTSGSPWPPPNGPQEFIGYAPEPGTMVLLGTGLFVLGGSVRKKLKRTAS